MVGYRNVRHPKCSAPDYSSEVDDCLALKLLVENTYVLVTSYYFRRTVSTVTSLLGMTFMCFGFLSLDGAVVYSTSLVVSVESRFRLSFSV